MALSSFLLWFSSDKKFSLCMYSSFLGLIRTESSHKANGTSSLGTGLIMAQKLTKQYTTWIQTAKEISETLLRGNIKFSVHIKINFFVVEKYMLMSIHIFRLTILVISCDIVINELWDFKRVNVSMAKATSDIILCLNSTVLNNLQFTRFDE